MGTATSVAGAERAFLGAPLNPGIRRTCHLTIDPSKYPVHVETVLGWINADGQRRVPAAAAESPLGAGTLHLGLKRTFIGRAVRNRELYEGTNY